VRLREVLPHGMGFVLVFEYMLSDLSEVIRNSERPLTEAQVSYLSNRRMLQVSEGDNCMIKRNNEQPVRDISVLQYRGSFAKLGTDGHFVCK
jgi:hypothetical protein